LALDVNGLPEPFLSAELLTSWGLLEAESHQIGRVNARPCFVVELVAGQALPSALAAYELRALLSHLDEAAFAVLGRAAQILTWSRDHRYCSRCGSHTVMAEAERCRTCVSCGFSQYPRINPCVITIITRGEELLLARAAQFRKPFYSALAGFIEAGESAEEALHREVMEEVGLRVGNLRYFQSQAWPFPHALMLGFHADYVSGEIARDEAELVDARWFHYRELPLIPPPYTISRSLIDAAILRIEQGN
jgi:NAD+ diphosphatase